MKKTTVFLTFCILLLTSCGGTKTLSQGKENESYLEFISQAVKYPDGVDVNVDNKTTFKAEVYKSNANRTKSTVYAITPGTHTISVSLNNKLLYQKQIFVSTQETKTISLP
jgi:hypothetical protein